MHTLEVGGLAITCVLNQYVIHVLQYSLHTSVMLCVFAFQSILFVAGWVSRL